MKTYLFLLITTILLSFFLTWLIIKIAEKFKIIDYPKGERKIHKKPIPLLGGLAIFISFFLVVVFNVDKIISQTVLGEFIILMFIGASILMVGGYFDDKYDLLPAKQMIAPIIATLLVVVGGLKIGYITNPFGGSLSLDFSLGVVITFGWILGMSYTTKILDGLDGLVTGITTIGAIIIFFASFQSYFVQPEIAVLAVILIGSCLGFLYWNFNPAKIFLGEGGSLLCGFLLASLAILAKGKIATALLVMGIPILDLIWVVFRRYKEGNSIKKSDRKHLHHRLIDAGFSHCNAVLIYYGLTAVFGGAALFLQSRGKFFTLIILVITMAIIAGYLAEGKKKIFKN